MSLSPLAMKTIELSKEFGITDKLELAHMLARLDVESGGFKRLTESMNYTPEGLAATWMSRFGTKLPNGKYSATPNELAKKLGRTKGHPANQEEIANYVYGSRMGNEANGTQDDDGWEYRGGGLTQLTGKGMYLDFLNYLHKQGKKLDLTIDTVDDWVRTEDGAVISAVWFWINHGCGELARKDDVEGVCKRINGGKHGLIEQKAALIKYKKYFGI